MRLDVILRQLEKRLQQLGGLLQWLLSLWAGQERSGQETSDLRMTSPRQAVSTHHTGQSPAPADVNIIRHSVVSHHQPPSDNTNIRRKVGCKYLETETYDFTADQRDRLHTCLMIAKDLHIMAGSGRSNGYTSNVKRLNVKRLLYRLL